MNERDELQRFTYAERVRVATRSSIDFMSEMDIAQSMLG